MTQDEDVSTFDRIASAFQRLTDAAGHLNKVADLLGSLISAIEHALKRLNLGVEAWVDVVLDSDDRSGRFSARQLGYAKLGRTWGLAVRSVEGNDFTDEWRCTEEYLFNESPRMLRLEAVKKLPMLLEKLIAMTDSTTQNLQQDIAYAQQFVSALKGRPTAEQQAAALQSGNAAARQAAALQGAPTTGTGLTNTELQLRALQERAGQPEASAPPKSAKEATARADRMAKERAERLRNAQRQGAADALEKS